MHLKVGRCWWATTLGTSVPKQTIELDIERHLRYLLISFLRAIFLYKMVREQSQVKFKHFQETKKKTPYADEMLFLDGNSWWRHASPENGCRFGYWVLSNNEFDC